MDFFTLFATTLYNGLFCPSSVNYIVISTLLELVKTLSFVPLYVVISHLILHHMTVTAIQKGRVDSEERIKIQIRVNDGPIRRFYPLKIKVKASQWKNGKVVSHPQANLYNDIIKREIASKELDEVKGVRPSAPVDLIKYGEKCIDYWRSVKKKKESTLKQFRAVLNKIGRYKSANIQEIDNRYFEGLLSYCYALGNKENTAWSTFNRLHAILEKAAKDKLIPANPLDYFPDSPQYKDPKRGYLTVEKLAEVEKFALAVDSQAQRFATLWFLIACYTGLRFSDMNNFDKKKDIVGGRLVKHNTKTGEIISLPIKGKIKQYFELVEYKPLKLKNQPYNRILKVIGERCGIDINMTAHLSRHTTGMLLANSGASIDETAAILAHTSTKHTAIYYKISNKRVDSAMDKII